jgi:hypothetical protein
MTRNAADRIRRQDTEMQAGPQPPFPPFPSPLPASLHSIRSPTSMPVANPACAAPATVALLRSVLRPAGGRHAPTGSADAALGVLVRTGAARRAAEHRRRVLRVRPPRPDAHGARPAPARRRALHYSLRAAPMRRRRACGPRAGFCCILRTRGVALCCVLHAAQRALRAACCVLPVASMVPQVCTRWNGATCGRR